MATVTARGLARRELLLNAMAELVAERGFHQVGIVEIGAAAGVSGSALYRHFENKQQMLVALLERVVDDLIEQAQVAVRDATSDDDALRALIAGHVDFALRDRSIIKVHDQEAHALPERDRHRLRANMRRYADRWVDVVSRLRPDRSRAAASVSVRATFGLLNSVADYDARLPADEEAALLCAMGYHALVGT
jgi:AcrR family transcriptional regulator